jgi:hypothetical protein
MSEISIRSEGRRHYVVGDTYPVREALRGAGLKWDPQAKAWWSGKRETAEAAISSVHGAGGNGNGGTAPQAERTDREAPGEDAIVAGRAEYKGRTYYLAGREQRGRSRHDDTVSPVTSRDGSRMLLYFRDGSSQFWAAAEAVEVTKTYRRSQTIAGLREYAEQAKQTRAQGYEDGIPDGRRYECDECGERVTRGDGSSCWETGHAH